MADEFARLQIRIDANSARFEQGMKRASSTFGRQASAIEGRAKQMEGRMVKSFGGISRQGRATFGNVSQQLQDVVVQAQMGTDAFRILGQQGPQIAGAFGPVGAAFGVLVALGATLAPALLGVAASSKDVQKAFEKLKDAQAGLKESQDLLNLNLEEMRQRFGENVEEANRLRVELAKIGVAEVTAQIRNLNEVLSDTFASFTDAAAVPLDEAFSGRGQVEARRRFIEDLKEIEEAFGLLPDQAVRLNAAMRQFNNATTLEAQSAEMEKISRLLEEFRVDLSTIPPEIRKAIGLQAQNRLALLESEKAASDLNEAIERGADSTGRFEGAAMRLKREIKEAADEAERLSRIQFQQATSSFKLRFRDEEALFALPVEPTKLRKPRRSGGGRKRKDTGAVRIVERSQDALASLQGEARLIGLTARARAVEAAAIARATAQEKLLNAAKAEGATITPKQIEQGKELLALIEAQTLANFDVQAAIDRSTKSAEDAAERQKELAESISEVSDRMLGAIQNAESFEDALKRVGIELLRLLGSGAVGEGPLGGAFNKLLGTSANGVVGALFGGSGASFDVAGAGLDSSSIFSGAFTFNAKGNAFRGGNVIPFAGGGVVNGPATFPMPNGIGLMGEAGPEAIMPLRRGPGGKLGVAASGGGGTTIVINSTFEGVNEATQEQLRGMLAQQRVQIMQEVPQVAAAGMAQRPALRGR